MTNQDAFKDEFTHSHGGQCYFVAVDPSFPLQVTDVARVVAQVAVQGDDAERSAYVDSQVQRATDAQPPAPAEPTPSNDDDDEEEEATPVQPKDTPESLEAKRQLVRDLVSQLAQAGRGSIQNLADRQLIGFTNLTLSLILGLFADNDQDSAARDELVRSLVEAIAPASESTSPANPALSTRYSALATIFNALPLSATRSRFDVLTTLVESAAHHDDIAIVRPALAENQLELYFKQSNVVDNSESEAVADETTSRIVEALLKNAAGPKAADPVGTARLAREILLARLSASSSSSTTEMRTKLGATLLALSFASNDVFDFTPFSRDANRFPALHSGASSSNSALSRTLDLFTTRSDAELDIERLPSQADLDAAIAGSTLLPSTSSSASASSSSSSSTSPSSTAGSAASASPTRLDRAQLERKVKLVKLAQLCEDKVGGQVRYEEIKNKLGLKGEQASEEDEGEEVETWVIDAIRASLLQGRLSQPTQSLFVTRAAPVAPGAFSNDKWTTVQQRLEGWKYALQRVTQTVEKSLNVTAPSGQAGGGRRAGAEEVMANHHQQQAIEA